MLRSRKKGFTLVEVIIAGTLSTIVLAGIMQFFLAQLNQYRLISGYNKLNESLRIFGKFFEKDVHNALSFYVFSSEGNSTTSGTALNFTKANMSSYTFPKVGNCLLLIEERGMISGGRGTLYYVGSSIVRNGQLCYPLYRTLVTFNTSNKIAETASSFSNLPVAYLKPNADETGPVTFFSYGGSTGIFYLDSRKMIDTEGIYTPGCRHGVYFKGTMLEPGLHGQSAELTTQFCFFSRNPRFL